MENNIYCELEQVRQDLRTQLRNNGVRDFTVCTDSVLRRMVQQLPQTLEEFQLIPGVTPVLLNYAPAFLEVLQKSKTKQPLQALSVDVREEISRTQDRLIKMSATNPMLYIPAMAPRTMADLWQVAERDSVLPFLRHDNDILEICDFKMRHSSSEDRLYKYFSILNREAEREEYRYGKRTLYVGYPLAVGVLGNGIKICAPLAFFPVSFSISSTRITMCHDTFRGALCNACLSTLTGAIHGTCAIGEVPRTAPALERLLVDYYHALGISLTFVGGALTPFDAATPDVDNSIDTLKVYNIAVCGRFPVHETAVQVDCQVMCQREQTTPLINDLFESDYYAGTYSTEEEPVSEINGPLPLPADVSQCKFIAAASERDVVLTGAPDTGVMQAVANFILKSIIDNPSIKIAVVSELPGAVDRLEECLCLGEIPIVRLFDASRPQEYASNILSILNKMDKNVHYTEPEQHAFSVYAEDMLRWEEYARTLHHTPVHGCTGKELYEKGIELSVRELDPSMPLIRKCIEPGLTKMSLPKLESIYEKYTPQITLRRAHRVWNMQQEIPMFRYMQRTLSDEAIIALAELIGNAKKIKKREELFPRLINVLCMSAEDMAKAIGERFFESNSIGNWQSIYDTPDEVLPLLVQKFRDHRSSLERLGHISPLEWSYYCSLQNLLSTKLVNNASEANTLLMRALINIFLCDLEKHSLASHDCRNLSSCFHSCLNKEAELSAAMMDKVHFICEQRRTAYMRSPASQPALIEVHRAADNASSHIVPVSHLLAALPIWAMTPDAMSSVMPLDAGCFDVVIYLNAGQIRADRAIPSLYRARRVIIAGDISQTLQRPVYEYDTLSLLEVAVDKLPHIQMDCYYGSGNADVMRFANTRFYNNTLNIIDNMLLPIASGIEWTYVQTAVWEKNCNEKEAETVVDTVVKCIKSDPDCDIAVVSFSTRQRERIALLLSMRAETDSDFNSFLSRRTRKILVTDVTDSYFETHDVVVVSVSITVNMLKDMSPAGSWAVFFSDAAVCAACTRAREKLYLISSVTATDIAAVPEALPTLASLHSLLEFAENPRISVEAPATTSTAQAIVEIRAAVAESAKCNGFLCEYNVGCGEYSIDIAVRNRTHWKLAILLDSVMGSDAGESAALMRGRMQYLSARGWKLHYVRIQDWYREKEIEELVIQETIAMLS